MLGSDIPIRDNLDVVFVHPGSARESYGDLAEDLIAVEPPLYLRLIAGYVKDRGYNFRIIDAEAERKSPSTVALDVFALRPRLVCIVAQGHQPSSSTQQMDVVYEIARQIKSVCTARIVVTGGHVSVLPERTLRECRAIDYVCVGEGPATVIALLDATTNFALQSVPGLMWRSGADQGRHVIRTDSAPLIEDLSQLHGDVWDKLPMQKYVSHNWHALKNLNRRTPYASIYTSLGCPWRCAFCCINAPFQSNRYRMRNPAEVVAEVRKLHVEYGVSTFKITDEMFVLNEKHYTAICEGLAALPFADELNFWSYARVDTVKPHTLALLRRAGIKWLALGIESESAYVRDGVDKRLKRDDIAEVVKAIQAAGINVIANYIFGLPDDDLESMRRTLQMAIDLRTEWANFYSAMAYPGSPLYDEAVKKGWGLPDIWSGYSQHGYETRPLDTRHVDAATVLKFRDEAHQIYFSSARFLDDTLRKFGPEAVKHVQAMTKRELPRKLLQETFVSRDKVKVLAQ
jgi:anaerobic magnesium-protoporphyrin IX monomethyl ester cyclase